MGTPEDATTERHFTPSESSLAPNWIQYKCRGCGEVCLALKDSLCGHYQVCETCARARPVLGKNHTK